MNEWNEPGIMERIVEVVGELSEEYALEVLDFAEFLLAKQEEAEPFYQVTESADVRDILEAVREMRQEGGNPLVDLPEEE